MNIRQWQDRTHEIAKQKGWWVDKEEDPKNMTPEAILAQLMMVTGEIAEASEQVRLGNNPMWLQLCPGLKLTPVMSDPNEIDYFSKHVNKDDKPEGALIELADAVLRILDLCGFMGWDLEKAMTIKSAYNETREFKHGGKLL